MILFNKIIQGEGDSDSQDNDDNDAVQKECLEAFGSVDYIMEPEVFNMLKRYILCAHTRLCEKEAKELHSYKSLLQSSTFQKMFSKTVRCRNTF